MLPPHIPRSDAPDEYRSELEVARREAEGIAAGTPEHALRDGEAAILGRVTMLLTLIAAASDMAKAGKQFKLPKMLENQRKQVNWPQNTENGLKPLEKLSTRDCDALKKEKSLSIFRE